MLASSLVIQSENALAKFKQGLKLHKVAHKGIWQLANF